MNTTENDKLIAEFMNALQYGDLIVIANIPTHIDNSKYHSSWDWLMEVCKKILFLPREYKGHYNYIGRIENGLLQVDIKAVYNAVAEFITWYNSQQQK